MNNPLDENAPQTPQVPPPNYLVWGILTTVLCCLPFGIVSIVYAAQVNSKWAGGDYEGARQASKNAKIWAWVAFGAAFAAMLLWFLLAVIIGIAGLGLEALESVTV